MTYAFLVRKVYVTIYVPGPFNPDEAMKVMVAESGVDIADISMIGTVGVFIPNLR